MTKKILLSLFVLLMAAVSIVAYNFYKNVKQPVSKTSFEAIPQNAALIIKENNFNALYSKLSSTNIVWEELISNTNSAKNINAQFRYLDSLMVGPFKPLVVKKTLLASLHLSGANDYDFIFYIPLQNQITEEKLIQKIKTVTKKNTSQRVYDGVNIYTLPTNAGSKISLTFYKNTLAFSYSTVLIEDVIRQLNSETSLINDVDFAQLTAHAGQSEDGNILINNQHFSKIINQYLNKSTRKYMDKFDNYTGWTELDVNLKSNNISLNGFSFSNDKSNHTLTLFKNQKPQDLDAIAVTPYNAAFIFHFGLSNSKLFFDNRKLSLKNTNQFFNYQSYLDQQSEKFGIDLEEELIANIGNELTFIVTESQNNDFTNNKFVLFKMNDFEKTKSDLLAIGNKTNLTPFLPIKFNSYEINKININNLFKNLLGKPFINLTEHYYTFIDDYVIFGNSENALKSYLTTINNNKTLEKNDNFKSFYDNLSSSSNIFIYNNISRSSELYKLFCKENLIPIIDEKIDVLRKFEAIAIQISTEKKGLYYNNIYLKYNPVYKKETSSLWELALDSVATKAPQLLVNHKTKSKEIFIQDDANKIYLISNIGKVIWTKQLQEPILGKVHQIDVYKNNKLQILFNTASKIYLLDRNGNNVEKYPVNLLSKATNGITPLDYAHNRNYRLLIGCQNNMVYNYDVHGDLVKGWEYNSKESFANNKIWHFVIANKDYIAIPLHNGKIKVIQRNGKDRLNLENTFITDNTTYLKVGSELAKTYFISTDTLGNIVKLFFNDKQEIIQLENSKNNNTFSFFDYDNNNTKDFILSFDNTIKIVNQEKKTLYTNEFESTIKRPIKQFLLSDKTVKFGITTANEIYLINAKGEIEDGFPLAGSTQFSIADINNDKTTNLVVVNGSTLYTYNLK